MALFDNLENDIEALLEKVPQSVMETPWKRTLFWVVYGVFALAVILLFAIFGLLKGIFEESGKHSHSYIDQAENEQREKENLIQIQEQQLFMDKEERNRDEPSVFTGF